MSVCEGKVYPPDVVKYVKDQLIQMKAGDENDFVDDSLCKQLPESMQLTDRMEKDEGLRDALVSAVHVARVWNKLFNHVYDDVPPWCVHRLSNSASFLRQASCCVLCTCSRPSWWNLYLIQLPIQSMKWMSFLHMKWFESLLEMLGVSVLSSDGQVRWQSFCVDEANQWIDQAPRLSYTPNSCCWFFFSLICYV